MVVVFILLGLSSQIVTLVEVKFSVYIGQKTHEWAKIKSKVTFRVAYMSVAIFLLTLLVSLIVEGLAGML